MINEYGLKLIDIRTDEIAFLDLLASDILRVPNKKYLINKVNVFDPTVVIQRNPYWDDEFTIDFVASPGELKELISFIENRQSLYIEYYTNDELRQYLVTAISKLPQEPNDGRFWNYSYQLKLNSKYKTLEVLDFGEFQAWDLSWGEVWGGIPTEPEEQQ